MHFMHFVLCHDCKSKCNSTLWLAELAFKTDKAPGFLSLLAHQAMDEILEK